MTFFVFRTKPHYEAFLFFVMNKITPRNVDFSQWYLDIIEAAELAEHSAVRGSMTIKPYGYAIWENIQQVLDKQFKELGIENAYFPLLIPESFLQKEAKHIEGFAPELAIVTHAGGEKLKENYVIRPTSETIIYETYSRWVQSYRDLPLLINQWNNVMRWEMRPRLFLRTTEFLWQEGHTAHSSPEEARNFAIQMHKVYINTYKDYLAMPSVFGQKSPSETFAGALETYSVESMMQDGKALQACTSHYFGNNFARNFNVKFLNKDNQEEFAYTTSWGWSTRSIGGLIMSHSDDKGLVLPPKIAPIQVVIIPVIFKDEHKVKVLEVCSQIEKTLKESNFKVKIDLKDDRIGEKIFKWEKKGVPLRIEIGMKDIEREVATISRRDIEIKEQIPLNNLLVYVENTLEKIQQNLYNKIVKMNEDKTKEVNSWTEFEVAIEQGNFVLAHWNGKAETESQIKEKTKATIRCLPFEMETSPGKCILTGEYSPSRVLFAKAY